VDRELLGSRSRAQRDGVIPPNSPNSVSPVALGISFMTKAINRAARGVYSPSTMPARSSPGQIARRSPFLHVDIHTLKLLGQQLGFRLAHQPVKLLFEPFEVPGGTLASSPRPEKLSQTGLSSGSSLWQPDIGFPP